MLTELRRLQKAGDRLDESTRALNAEVARTKNTAKLLLVPLAEAMIRKIAYTPAPTDIVERVVEEVATKLPAIDSAELAKFIPSLFGETYADGSERLLAYLLKNGADPSVATLDWARDVGLRAHRPLGT